MSSFGNSAKTSIEQELTYIYKENYGDNESDKFQFIRDVLGALEYIVEYTLEE